MAMSLFAAAHGEDRALGIPIGIGDDNDGQQEETTIDNFGNSLASPDTLATPPAKVVLLQSKDQKREEKQMEDDDDLGNSMNLMPDLPKESKRSVPKAADTMVDDIKPVPVKPMGKAMASGASKIEAVLPLIWKFLPLKVLLLLRPHFFRSFFPCCVCLLRTDAVVRSSPPQPGLVCGQHASCDGGDRVALPQLWWSSVSCATRTMFA